MAKIDITQIEGYTSMTAEEKVSALEAFELPETDYTGWIKKDTYDKTASELAKVKKELRERMSAEEAEKEKEKEEREELEEKYNKLLRDSEINKNKSKLIAMGYDEALADETAIAMIDGDTEKVFANQKKHIEAVEKKAKTEALKDTPKPKSGGSGDDVMTLDKFRKLSPRERYDFSMKHPDEYKRLYTVGG